MPPSVCVTLWQGVDISAGVGKLFLDETGGHTHGSITADVVCATAVFGEV